MASYVEKCAASLFGQTLDDLEIIFVDDCSPDNSIELVKKTLENYPERICSTKILRKPSNGGLAAARKYGLEYANGEYVIHCDSDDWVDFPAPSSPSSTISMAFWFVYPTNVVKDFSTSLEMTINLFTNFASGMNKDRQKDVPG